MHAVFLSYRYFCFVDTLGSQIAQKGKFDCLYIVISGYTTIYCIQLSIFAYTAKY